MGCKRCLWCCFIIVIGIPFFVVLSSVVKILGVWDFVHDSEAQCHHPPLPANQSGVKLIIAGYAKSGTRTICHALNDLNIRTYHSEDMHLWSLWHFVSNYRKLGHAQSLMSQGAITIDPAHERSKWLAESLSRCRVEAIAYDGLEHAMKPTIHVSPGAKVIVLGWRTYEQWRKSLAVFGPKLMVMSWFNFLSGASTNLFPWAAILWLVDPLLGSPLATALREGGPPITEVSGPMLWLYHQSLNFKKQYTSWNVHPTASFLPTNASQYYGFMDEIRTQAKNYGMEVIEWSHKEHGFEDLCRIAGVQTCPKKGKLPRAINTWVMELDFPIASNLTLWIRLYLWWVNWRICCAGFALMFRCCSCCRQDKLKTK